MDTVISIDKGTLVQKFLSPISKVASNIVLNVEKDDINTICTSQDGSFIVYAKLNTAIDIETPLKLNLLDIDKFIRLLGCIEKVGDISLTVKNNNITYNDNKSFNFVYHLSEDGYIPKCPLNVTKINKLQFDTEFELTVGKFNEIMKAASIVTDSNKFYLYTKNGSVYGELNDRETPNSNNITYLINEEYTGESIEPAVPLNLEHLRLISGIKTSKINVKFNNSLKITVFEIQEDNILVKFIISALVK